MRRSAGGYRLRLRDLAGEALAGVLQRPGRSTATMVGTMLGVGSLVAILGLAQTAAGQVSAQFSVLDATQVTVTDTAPPPTGVSSFPHDAETRIERLNGAVAAGWYYPVSAESRTTVAAAASPQLGAVAAADVFAVTPGMARAAQIDMVDGVTFDAFHDRHAQRVAIVSRVVADQLGLPSVAQRPAIFVDGVALTVIGVMAAAARAPQFGVGVLVPVSTAAAVFPRPTAGRPAQMLIRTDVGAASLIAAQAPLALRPDAPDVLQAVSPADTGRLGRDVAATVNTLLLALAAVAVVAGAMSIATTMTVSTLERVGEIGLRRSLGARPWHVAAQFLAEAAVLGLVGGIIGTAFGVVGVVATAIAKDWTAIVDPTLVGAMPPAGAVVGLVAGAIPSMRAARIEPAAALRR